jgi:hypothetical protein
MHESNPIESPTAGAPQAPAPLTGLAAASTSAPRNRKEARAALAGALPRAARKRRQRNAIRRLILMAHDSALIMRGDGRVQMHSARLLNVPRGSGAYWAGLFSWILRATDEDAQDRRDVLMEHFEEALRARMQPGSVGAADKYAAADTAEAAGATPAALADLIDREREVLDALAEGPPATSGFMVPAKIDEETEDAISEAHAPED